MPCYSPLNGYQDVSTGKWSPRRTSTAYKPLTVACGGCIGCRLDRSRSWAMRCLHESTMHSVDGVANNSFITLTYRSKQECTPEQLKKGLHVPDDWSLPLYDFTKFMKRLRKATPQKIKYFACGEYGDRCEHLIPGDGLTVKDCPYCNVGRPHFHSVIFNRVFPDAEHIGTTTSGEPLCTSAELEKIWGYGHVQVANEVNFQTAAYVARYILKKRTGSLADEHYYKADGDYWVVPEFIRMSTGRRCKEHRNEPFNPDCDKCTGGIGLAWYEKHKADIFPSDEVPLPHTDTPVVKKVPRYYEEALRKVDEALYKEIKERRVEYRSKNKAEYTPERLMAKYKVKKAQTKVFMERA